NFVAVFAVADFFPEIVLDQSPQAFATRLVRFRNGAGTCGRLKTVEIAHDRNEKNFRLRRKRDDYRYTTPGLIRPGPPAPATSKFLAWPAHRRSAPRRLHGQSAPSFPGPAGCYSPADRIN